MPTVEDDVERVSERPIEELTEGGSELGRVARDGVSYTETMELWEPDDQIGCN